MLTPVKFYLNRYRAVVWLYLAVELRQFAADLMRLLLAGQMRFSHHPEGLRRPLPDGVN